MEIVKEDIQILKTKSRAVSQVTFDMDYNVPDVKPDIGRMIQNKGEITVDELRVSDGHAYVKGSLKADLLYVEDKEGRVCSLTAMLPMEETLNLEGLVNGDKIKLKWEIEDLSIHLIHSRKMNIKAVAALCAVVDELCGIRIPESINTQDVSVKKKKMNLMSLCVHKKDTLRLKEEIQLVSNKPNVAELLWHTVEIRALDLRAEENCVKARGEMFLFVMYTGDDENNTVQWLEHSVPFTGEVECSGCAADMIPNIESGIVSQSLEVKPDADGEERIFQADVVLELDMKLYREEEHDMILDVYTPFRECVLKSRNEKLESLLIRNFSKCRLSDRIEVKETQGKILQICHSQGRVKTDKLEIVKDGIRVTGIVILKILYIVGNDDMPFYSMEAMLPFNYVVEVRGIKEDSMYYLQAGLEQLSTTMPDGNEIEVRATVSLNTLAFAVRGEKIIEQVEDQPLDPEKIRNMPGIVVYMVKPGDTLWDIAKKFYTTTEEICSMNELENEEIQTGQPLLLIKKVEE